MSKQLRSGFTLVELLVVIAIIGVLVALLVPAVNAARELARKAECMNNLRNMGQAMGTFEADKQHFPGRVSFMLSNQGRPIPLSWTARLLPYMEGNNVYDNILEANISLQEWNTVLDGIANPTAVPAGAWFISDLAGASCPSDPKVSQIAARTSYAMNAGVSDYGWSPDPSTWGASSLSSVQRANGVGNWIPYNSTNGRVDKAFISKNDGTSNTIMISENVNAISWVMLTEGANCLVWTPQDTWLAANQSLTEDRQYGINSAFEGYLDDQLLQTARSNPAQLESVARPSSNHSSGVNVVYCDGHAELLSADIHPWIYARRMSTAKKEARHPALGLNTVVPAQVAPNDANGTAVPTEY